MTGDAAKTPQPPHQRTEPTARTTVSQPRPPAAPTLTDRASLAAHHRSHRARSMLDATTDWTTRATIAARLTATILGVDPATVSAVPDPDRYPMFAWTDVRLIVMDALLEPSAPIERPQTIYEFICDPTGEHVDALLLLRPCPECQQQVPTYRVQDLADLGDVINAEHAEPFHRLRPDARSYPTDPAHRPDCPIRWRRHTTP